MSMAESCSTQDETYNLKAVTNISEEILKKVSALEGGEMILFELDRDFSKELIAVVTEHFSDTNIKAKFVEEGPSKWVIKVKLPKDGEGCCGCCGN